VIFDNLANPSHGAWKLTGAVTFYESPVDIRSTVFRNIRAEDGLNIVRSEFLVDSSLFSECMSDAFDGDFVDGTVRASVFRSPGNDGLDFSGSAVRLDDLAVVDAGDKGLSAGEASRVTATDISITGAVVGVAAKDLSEVSLTKVSLSRCRTGFAVYRKKSEFGPARIEVDSLAMAEVVTPHRVETGSRLVIDGTPVPGDQNRVEEMLYGGGDY
jgi:hypothetical protein